MDSDQIIRWTIRIALALYLLGVCGQLVDRDRSHWRWWRAIWTAACVVFVLHVLSAFAWHHHWNHEHAIAETAAETEAKLGFAFGEGIYFSYLFTVLWIADVSWWWLGDDSYAKRPYWLHNGLHLFLFFIAFNGAVVFEGGPIRWWGIVGSLLIVALALFYVRNIRAKPTPSPAADP